MQSYVINLVRDIIIIFKSLDTKIDILKVWRPKWNKLEILETKIEL